MASWHGLYSYVADRAAAAAGGREGKTHEVQGKQDIKKFYSKEEGFLWYPVIMLPRAVRQGFVTLCC